MVIDEVMEILKEHEGKILGVRTKKWGTVYGQIVSVRSDFIIIKNPQVLVPAAPRDLREKYAQLQYLLATASLNQNKQTAKEYKELKELEKQLQEVAQQIAAYPLRLEPIEPNSHVMVLRWDQLENETLVIGEPDQEVLAQSAGIVVASSDMLKHVQ